MSAKGEKTKMVYQTTFTERMAFGIFGIGGNIFFVLIGSFLQQYYLINAAVPAATVALIFLIVKIWDGINDPLFGIIVDRSNLKKGKFLPWMRVATFFLPITVAMLFFVPLSAPVWVKAAFLLIGYMLYDAAATMTEVPYFAITTAMTSNPAERASIISFSKIIAMVPMVSVLFIPALYQSIGWQLTVIIFSVFALVTMLPGCFILKERSLVRPESPPKVKELLRYIASNRYLLIFFASAIIYGLTNTVGLVGNLFAIYNLGSDNMIMPLLVMTTVPSILIIPVVNILIKKIDKRTLLLCTLLVTGLSSIALYFAGYENMTVFYILTVIRGFSAGAHTMLFFLFTPDLSEYGTYTTGIQAEGAAFSIQSFASKILAAISSASALFILAAFGFMEGATVQSVPVMNGIWLLFSAFPAVGATIQAAILLGFYKLRDKDVLVMSQANHGEISYDEAAVSLEGRFQRKVKRSQ